VALAEPQFFSDLNHPARKLIDRMGSCVMGFDASSINGNALETESPCGSGDRAVP
jgi:hypothetical protein